MKSTSQLEEMSVSERTYRTASGFDVGSELDERNDLYYRSSGALFFEDPSDFC